MLVPVHVLGRDLRYGPILLVTVQMMDRDQRGRAGSIVRKKMIVEGREKGKGKVKRKGRRKEEGAGGGG